MGLVNLAVNAQHRDHISEKVDLILPLLQSRDTETLISTLTLLYYLQLVYKIYFSFLSCEPPIKMIRERKMDHDNLNDQSLVAHLQCSVTIAFLLKYKIL